MTEINDLKWYALVKKINTSLAKDMFRALFADLLSIWLMILLLYLIGLSNQEDFKPKFVNQNTFQNHSTKTMPEL